MYSSNLFGLYYQKESSIHKMNVVIKLINYLIFTFIMITSHSLSLHLFMLLFLTLEIIISNVPFKFYFNIIFSLRYIYLILIFMLASKAFTLELTITILLKIILVLLNSALFSYTTSQSEFDYALYKVLNPINFLNLNISVLSNFVKNIIDFYPSIIMTERRILKSQASRGIDYIESGITGKIYAISNSFKNNIRLYIENLKVKNELKEIRLNNIKGTRTVPIKNKINTFTICMFLFHILFLIIYIMEEVMI